MSLRALRALAALAATVALVLSACGGSGDPASSASSGQAAAASPTKVTAKGGGNFCASLAQSLNDTKSLTTDAQSGQPSALKALVEKARQEAAKIVSSAPAALKADVQTLVNASTSYYDALAAANYDLRKVDASKISSLTSGNVAQAAQRVSAYVQSQCGIDVGGS